MLNSLFKIDASVKYIGPENSLNTDIIDNHEYIKNIYILKENKNKFKKYIELIKVLKSYKNERGKKTIIIFSYELREILFLILLRVIFIKDTIKVIEHNTIPSKGQIYFKKIAFLITNLIFEKIVLSLRAKNYLLKVYKKKSIYLPHPISVSEEKSYLGNYIFSPSGTTTDDENTSLIKKFFNEDLVIYIKSNTFDSESFKVICSKKFESYDQLIAGANLIYIGGKGFELRESGPLYDALGYKKTVLMSDGDLYREMRDRGFNVCLLDEHVTGSSLEYNREKYLKFIELHGDASIIKNLKIILELNDE